MAVHAHPDDEVISTGGVLSRYADNGATIIVVTCTDGSQGFGPGGSLPGEAGHDPEAVARTRRAELGQSCSILGVTHLELLGYRDSGMAGWAANDRPDAFCNTPVEDVAARVAALIERYEPDVLVTYDDNGGYGHPDHIQTHQVAIAALERENSVQKVYYTARSQSQAARVRELRQRLQSDSATRRPLRASPTGVPDDLITTVVDTLSTLGRKREALLAHGSQLSDSIFVKLDDQTFADLFGRESFIRSRDRTGALLPETDLFAGLSA
jgi:LmbE family N-acetylglucosaminyl deacetylase